MGKDLKGRELGKGFYPRKDGRYEARAKVNGNDVSIYGFNLRELKKDFQELKEQLPYVDQDLRKICQSLYKKLKNMTADAFAEIDFLGEEDVYE